MAEMEYNNNDGALVGKAENMMIALMKGEIEVDEDDWAAECQKRVVNGSDGLWCRFGAAMGPGIKNQCFAFRFNPCVSFFAVVLLFSLVGFCSIPPGHYCTNKEDLYSFTVDGVAYQGVSTNPAPTAPGTLTDHLTFEKGSGIEPFVLLDVAGQQVQVNKSGTVSTVTLKTEQRITQDECFMPKKEFDDWMAWVTRCFTWLYIITQDVWILFVVWLYFSKYGNLKLGRDDDEPEFTYFAWFAMLFTCGVATGLFYFAVSEPQYYYNTKVNNAGYYERNRWTYKGVYYEDEATGANAHAIYSTPNDRAQNAMTTTWYHWGLHGWVCYSILGLLLGFLHFRKGLPMTIKSCFYPLLGTRIYGFLGDFLDTVSVVATTMGVCTSLGLGVMQLNSGMELLNGDQHWWGLGYYNKYNYDEWKDRVSDLKVYWDSYPAATKASSPWFLDTGEINIATAANVATMEAQNNEQQLLIWIITACATCSVMLGLKNGIKVLALVCLALGQFLMFYIWVMDDTWFLSNLFMQTLGHYVGEMPTLGFYSSAVEQSEVNNPYGEYASWQYWWTIFYWGWWIAWAPFVGVFLARIGKGRTIKEFIFCTLVSACIYNFIFMNMLGGAGIKMQMLAEKYDVGTTAGGGCGPDTMVTDADGSSYIKKAYKENICRQIDTRKYSGEPEYFCSTITNLACSLNVDGTRPLFDVIGQYSDVGRGLIILTEVALVLYFVASSDSGSMVDDMLTANGLPEPCLVQRFIWAMTEGAAASALLSVGKYVGKVDGGLKALRSASICVGLPYTFLICLMCVSLLRALQYEMKDRKWTRCWNTCVIDIGVTLYSCGAGQDRCFNFECGKIEIMKLGKFFVYTLCPVLPALDMAGKLVERKKAGSRFKSIITVVGVAVVFYSFLACMFIDYAPTADTPQEWGSVMGNEDNVDGNSRFYLTNRYGYYHGWKNQGDQREVGDLITYNTVVQADEQERGISQTIDGVSTMVGMGDRMAHSMRVAAIGWFLFFMFATWIASVRNEIRELYALPGSLFEDFLVSCFYPLALNQMVSQLEMKPPSKEEVTGKKQREVTSI